MLCCLANDLVIVVLSVEVVRTMSAGVSIIAVVKSKVVSAYEYGNGERAVNIRVSSHEVIGVSSANHRIALVRKS